MQLFIFNPWEQLIARYILANLKEASEITLRKDSAVVWTNDSLVFFFIFELRPDSESLWKSASDEPIRFGDKAIFRPKKLTWNLSFWDFWSGQKTPWCWGDLGKRLLGARAESAPRSLLSRSPQHQGVFWPDQKSQKLKFQVSFLGLNIALTPNLIGSSDADFHKDSESGLNSKIEKTPRSLLSSSL